MDLAQVATELLAPLGFEVLELKISDSSRNRRLLLRIDRLDEQAVSIEDVATVSEVFGLELDRLDPIARAYQLEVESPGPERPLKRIRHFERFHDLLAKVRVGEETFRGIIREVSGEMIAFDVGNTRKMVRLADIESAQLAEWPTEPR
ncbi:MAG: ribosome maturation factor RimP [Trueperaceae bacterium]|nr:MAG: ribosome maturation factor RimP [Trueperaceae bacterium]